MSAIPLSPPFCHGGGTRAVAGEIVNPVLLYACMHRMKLIEFAHAF